MGRVASILAVAAVVAAATTSRGADAPSPPAWEVYRIFEAHCVSCHGGHLARPKGKFGYILDLPRLVQEGLVEPGDPESSDLFRSLISVDPEEKMPPPDTEDVKPLSEAQIAVVRAWITAGAGLVAPVTTDAATSNDPAGLRGSTSTPDAFPPTRLFGRLHPVLVHFPIALLLAALAAALAGRINPSCTWCAGMVRGSLWLGTAGAIAAAAAGWFNAAHEGHAAGAVDQHRILGLGTVACALLALVAHEWSVRRTTGEDRARLRRALAAIALIIAAGLVAWAGHTGGLLAYGERYFLGG